MADSTDSIPWVLTSGQRAILKDLLRGKISDFTQIPQLALRRSQLLEMLESLEGNATSVEVELARSRGLIGLLARANPLDESGRCVLCRMEDSRQDHGRACPWRLARETREL